jgi:hypothetical protein
MTPCGGLVYMLRWLPARYLTWEQYLRHFRPGPHNSKGYAYRAMTFIPPTSLAKRVSKCELVVSAHFAAVHPTQGVLDAASSLGVLIRGNFLSEQLALASPLPSRSLQHVINGKLQDQSGSHSGSIILPRMGRTSSRCLCTRNHATLRILERTTGNELVRSRTE